MLLHGEYIDRLRTLAMRTVFFSNYQLPGLAGTGLLSGQAPPQARDWQDELTRHQAIYEELLTSPDWTDHAAPRSPAPLQRALSARDLTCDLAGWSLPQPRRRPTVNS